MIALEEHYQDPEVKQLGAGPGAGREVIERLDDLGALRIREMDEAGIDLQVLSHSIPGLQAVRNLRRGSFSISIGNSTLLMIDRHGRSTGDWNTMPTSRRGPRTGEPPTVILPALSHQARDHHQQRALAAAGGGRAH